MYHINRVPEKERVVGIDFGISSDFLALYPEQTGFVPMTDVVQNSCIPAKKIVDFCEGSIVAAKGTMSLPGHRHLVACAVNIV